MAMECVCIVVDPSDNREAGMKQQSRGCVDKSARNKNIDLCEIVKRSQDESSKHNDYECHLKGERRQNLINKMRMFLDDYDDRPVMKGKGKGSDDNKVRGQTGFGPMIKYPGYVDYDHPYFSSPYNQMPTLAMTVGQRGENPCVPLQVRNWDECYQQQKSKGINQLNQDVAAAGGQSRDQNGCGCRCAQRRGEDARCVAAEGTYRTTGAPAGGNVCQKSTTDTSKEASALTQRKMAMVPPDGGFQYICIPLPCDD